MEINKRANKPGIKGDHLQPVYLSKCQRRFSSYNKNPQVIIKATALFCVNLSKKKITQRPFLKEGASVLYSLTWGQPRFQGPLHPRGRDKRLGKS